MNKIFIFFTVLLLSCTEQKNRLEWALEQSGEYRKELEKVLMHYSQSNDSLKLKAAIFLIENMPGHYTLVDNKIKFIRNKLKEDSVNYYHRVLLDIGFNDLSNHTPDICRKLDIQNITSDFLIKHIDQTFKIMDKCPWIKNLKESDILEYILPYRFENEDITTNWRDSIFISDKILGKYQKNDELKKSIFNSYDKIKVKDSIRLPNYRYILELFGKNMFMDCFVLSYKNCFDFRSKCIPAAVDFIPVYANRNGFHFWCNIINPTNKEYEIKNTSEKIASKIYRRTYSHNKICTGDINEYIPAFFRDPFNKDVTDLYLNTCNIEIDVINKPNNSPKNSYLCNFSNFSWVPVASGELKRKKAKFKNMGKEVIYLPICYENDNMMALNYPFILNSKEEIKYLEPDSLNRFNIRLERKYPNNTFLISLADSLGGLLLLASNDPQFSEYDTVIRFESTNNIIHDYKTNFEIEKRYWALKGEGKKKYYIGEFKFMNSDGSFIKSKVPEKYNDVIDDDYLTHIILEDKIVFDLERSTIVDRIVCLPRSDGNGIYPNNVYELFYFDLNGWNSLGIKHANDFFIDFDNIPSNALYWLHNHTEGQEERIFIIKDGEVRFW